MSVCVCVCLYIYIYIYIYIYFLVKSAGTSKESDATNFIGALK